MKQYLSYDDIHQDTLSLLEKIPSEQLSKIEGIVAIARGGCIPGVIAAEQLSIINFRTVSLSSYSQGKQGAMKVLTAFESDKRWLVIDELVDSGKSMQKLKSMLPNSLFVSLYAKPAGAEVVDYFLREYSQEQWLVFPWEKKESLVSYEKEEKV